MDKRADRIRDMGEALRKGTHEQRYNTKNKLSTKWTSTRPVSSRQGSLKKTRRQTKALGNKLTNAAGETSAQTNTNTQHGRVDISDLGNWTGRRTSRQREKRSSAICMRTELLD